MRIWRRAWLYIRRKTGKSVLLLLVMFLLFSFVMIGILLHRTTNMAIRQTRQSIGGGFRIAPDMQNRDNTAISTVDGQTSVTYIGEPLDGKLIEAVCTGQEINACNSAVKGEALLSEELCLIDYNGKYQDDAVASHLVSVEADTDALLSASFRKGQVKLIESDPIHIGGENTAIISKTLALQNNLQIGDEIQLLPGGSGIGESVSVKISGFFTVEAAQQNTDIAAPVYLLENKIFLDLSGGMKLLGTAGADYVDFFVSDPAQVYEIMEELQKIDTINWKCFAVTASIDEYEKSAGPLLNMMELADTLLTVMGAVSIAVLSLIQSLLHKSRLQEMGIMLSIGISKAEILLQHFFETALLAAVAFVFAMGVSLAVWPYISGSVSDADTRNAIGQLSAAATGSMIAVTAGGGTAVLLLSAIFSNLWIMRLSPKEILSKLS